MKFHHLLPIAALFLTLPACERKQTPTEKATDTINDALDRRPGEKIRDAAEDVRDAAEDVGKDIKGAAKDAKEGAKDVAKDVKDTVKDTTK